MIRIVVFTLELVVVVVVFRDMEEEEDVFGAKFVDPPVFIKVDTELDEEVEPTGRCNNRSNAFCGGLVVVGVGFVEEEDEIGCIFTYAVRKK